jgi:magnesium chelatase subunit D
MGAAGPIASDASPLASGIVAVLEAFAASPLALRGLHLRGWAGPRRSQLLELLCSRSSRSSAHPHAARPRARADAPDHWLVLPHHSGVEQLESGVDLTLSLAGTRPARRAGLLDRAEPPIVVVPMAERLAAPLAAALAAALDEGRLALILLDEALDDEVGLWSGLRDRMGLSIDLRDEAVLTAVLAASIRAGPAGGVVAAGLSVEVTRASPARRAGGDKGQAVIGPVGLLEASQLAQLAGAAADLDVASARPLVAAARLARVLAARRGANGVEADDLVQAIRFCLLPHARRLPLPHDAGAAQQEEPDSPPPSDAGTEQASDPLPDGAAEDSTEPPAPPPESALDPVEPADHDDPSDSAQPLPDGAAERLVEAALASLPSGLLAELAARASRSRSRASSSGAGLLTPRGRGRGRSVGARRALPQAGHRLHLFATLRAAIPWQRLRRPDLSTVPASASSAGPRLRLRKDDLHVHRELHRRGTTTVFVVDASGSTALQRLNEAKGAIELLLADCYVRRDRVALVSFRGVGAELLLAPTRSLVAARRALAALPGGGGSPVAAGLELAARLVSALSREGDDTQLVVLTDGRANLTREGRPGRAEAAEQALQMAGKLSVLVTRSTLIDTSVRPEPAARALAQALQARYCPMPFARAQAIRAAIG